MSSFVEFLIKDYTIKKHPEKEDEIRKALLGKCIQNYISVTKIKECAKRATWIGNDETHYVRKWKDKDVKDLKILIQLSQIMNNENNSAKHSLEILIMIVGITSSISIVISVVYNFGYYSALNLDFSDIPITISDHIISSLNWVPLAIMIGIAASLELMILLRFEKEMNKELIPIKNPAKKKLIRQINDIYIIILAVLFLLINFIAGNNLLIVYIINITLIWIELAKLLIRNDSVRNKIDIYTKALFLIAPPFLLYIYTLGYTNALDKYNINYNASKITLIGKETPEKVIIFRSYEKGLLIKNNQNKIIFYPFSEIKKYETSGNKSIRFEYN